jgi:hypothetical protein
MSIPAFLVLLPLAVEKGPDPSDVKPGWLGFSVFLALAVAVALLAMSFVKQLKKIDFEEEPDPSPNEGDKPSSPPNASKA